MHLNHPAPQLGSYKRVCGCALILSSVNRWCNIVNLDMWHGVFLCIMAVCCFHIVLFKPNYRVRVWLDGHLNSSVITLYGCCDSATPTHGCWMLASIAYAKVVLSQWYWTLALREVISRFHLILTLETDSIAGAAVAFCVRMLSWIAAYTFPVFYPSTPTHTKHIVIVTALGRICRARVVFPPKKWLVWTLRRGCWKIERARTFLRKDESAFIKEKKCLCRVLPEECAHLHKQKHVAFCFQREKGCLSN